MNRFERIAMLFCLAALCFDRAEDAFEQKRWAKFATLVFVGGMAFLFGLIA